MTLQLLIQKVPGVLRYRLENPYPLDNAISFLNTNSLDGDLYGGYRYPSFKQTAPGLYLRNVTKGTKANAKNVLNQFRYFHFRFVRFALSQAYKENEMSQAA